MQRLRGPTGDFDILDAREEVVHFAGTDDALAFLQRFAGEPIAMATLRRVVGANELDVSRASDHAVLAHFARELASGRRHLLRRSPAIALPEAQKEEQPEEPLPASSARAPREETTWVAIELVDDEGKPVPGARYILQLPDGSTREGTLDFAGKARVDGLKPGTCKVSFPDYAPGEWSEA